MDKKVWTPPGVQQADEPTGQDKAEAFDRLMREAQMSRQMQAMMIAAATEMEPVLLGVVPQEDGTQVAVYATPQIIDESEVPDGQPISH